MLPHSVDKMMVEMRGNMDVISHNIIRYKHAFCNEFEIELRLEKGKYSEYVFDYLFNLYFCRNSYDAVTFQKNLLEFKSLDFLKVSETCEYIGQKYREFIKNNHKFIMDYFGLRYQEESYVERKIHDNRKEFKRKILELVG